MVQKPTEMKIQLDPGVTPISGRLTAGGKVVRFSGWLALASAIEQMMDHRLDRGKADL